MLSRISEFFIISLIIVQVRIDQLMSSRTSGWIYINIYPFAKTNQSNNELESSSVDVYDIFNYESFK